MSNQTHVVTINLGAVNAFLVMGEKPVLVDSGTPGSTNKILKVLEDHGIRGDELSLILLTHGHIDHYGSALDLKRRTGAPVAIYESDAKWPRTGLNAPVAGTGPISRPLIKPFSKAMSGRTVEPFEPDVVFTEERDLSEYGIDGRIITTPGHTDGSISVVLSSGDVIVGDLVFSSFVHDDKPSYPLIALSIPEVQRSIRKVLGTMPKTIHLGHGRKVSAASMRRRFGRDLAEAGLISSR